MKRLLLAVSLLAFPASAQTVVTPATMPVVAQSLADLLNPDVTQATLSTTVCVAGWSPSVRISSSQAARIKAKQVLALYGPDMPTTAFEENHKIPISLGGNPVNEANLVPQSYGGRWNARDSDALELSMHAKLCAGTITLAQAQAAFFGDWREAYLVNFGSYPRN